jgi:serine/threonine protein kinase
MLAFDADDHLVVKIIDLGVAKDVSGPNVDTTQAGVLIGNPKYMSPEQLGLLGEGEQIDGRGLYRRRPVRDAHRRTAVRGTHAEYTS